jgi:hypothetical protein
MGMARPTNMARFVIAGTLPNGEVFQTGFWGQAGAAESAASIQQYANDVRTEFNLTAGTIMRSLLPANAGFTEVRAYYYPTADGPASLTAIAALPLAGTGAESNSLPLQVAICLTLRTGFAGRRNNGRMFFPMLTEDLTNHQLTLSRAQAIADAMGSFFANLIASPTIPTPSVMSTVGLGTVRTITRVEVDSEPDVIRSRSNRATELFTAGANT